MKILAIINAENAPMIMPTNGSQSSETNRTISSIGIPITAVSSRGLRDFILYQLSSDSTVSSVSGGVYF